VTIEVVVTGGGVVVNGGVMVVVDGGIDAVGCVVVVPPEPLQLLSISAINKVAIIKQVIILLFISEISYRRLGANLIVTIALYYYKTLLLPSTCRKDASSGRV
jgi:hypothetical protein